MTARTTQPRPSKGPLGERGRRLQERLGVVPLAAITRRGVVPERLRASWSCLAAAAKAAGQPANCRRHEGWSRSPSPRTRQGTRSLIGARFQPDWGKPNVRLIGGREETGASRLCRAARGASCLPDHRLCGWTLPCQWFGQLDDSDWSRRDNTRTGVWIGGCKGERDEQGDEDRVGRRRRGVDAGGPAPRLSFDRRPTSATTGGGEGPGRGPLTGAGGDIETARRGLSRRVVGGGERAGVRHVAPPRGRRVESTSSWAAPHERPAGGS